MSAVFQFLKLRSGTLFYAKAVLALVAFGIGFFTPIGVSIALFAFSMLIISADLLIEAFGKGKKGVPYFEILLMLGAFAALATKTPWLGVAAVFIWQGMLFLQRYQEAASAKVCYHGLDPRPTMAHVFRKKQVIEVPRTEVKDGDALIVPPDGIVPVDGLIMKGNSEISYELLGADKERISVQEGDFLIAGTRNFDGLLALKAEPMNDTPAIELEKCVNSAVDGSKLQSLPKGVELFIALGMLVAAIVCVVIPFVFKSELALWLPRAVGVLLLAAVKPVSVSIGTFFKLNASEAARQGVIIRNGKVVENLAKTKLTVFDKNGVLTEHNYSVVGIELAKGIDRATFLRCAAISQHPSTSRIGTAIREYCGDVGYPPESFKEKPGLGVVAKFSSQTIHAGSARFLTQAGITVDEKPGNIVYLALDNTYLGCFMMSDAMRPGANEAVQFFCSMGTDIAMITGDAITATQTLANRLGISDIHVNLQPADKIRVLKELVTETSNSGGTLFIGKPNDSHALLTTATVTAVIGALGEPVRTDIASLSPKFSPLINAMSQSVQTVKLSKTVLIIAASAKAVSLAGVLTGILPPVAAVAVDAFFNAGTILLARFFYKEKAVRSDED